MPEFNWISEEIFTVEQFLSVDECRQYIALAESLGFDAAPINTALGPVLASEVRNNSRVMLDDSQRAELLWSRLRDYVPLRLAGQDALGLNERFRFYRYDPGQAFRWHFDGCFRRDNGERSRLTFMVYLNDDFEGGDTRFERVAIRPQTGMALVFVHELRHEGSAVVRGRKYVLRSDVMYTG